MEISLIIPVYNEALAIQEVVKEYEQLLKSKKYKYEIIVIDDGSKDNTVEIVKKMNVRLIQLPENRGTGAATNVGILNAKYETIIMTDGDCTYPAAPIPLMLEQLKDHDMVIGARISEKGTLKILRSTIKFLIRKLAEFISGYKIPDLNSGLRIFKKNDVLKFFNILPNTHSWVSTITLCYLCNYYNVKFIPIEYHKRKGKSSFHFFKDTYNYLALIFRTIMYFYPLKIFIPLSIIIISFGCIRAIAHSLVGPLIQSDIIIITIGGFSIIVGLLADLIIKSTRSQYFKWVKGSIR